MAIMCGRSHSPGGPLDHAARPLQAAPPTVEEVGDPDSFGRDVIHLGANYFYGIRLYGDSKDK